MTKPSTKKPMRKKAAAVESSTLPRAFKVLVDGASCHGGTLSWNLPNGKPGEWHEVKGKIRACSNGLHLTTAPINWWKDGAKLYEAEYEGDTDTMDDKIAVRRCRLLREVSWDDHFVWSSGEHVITEGRALAFGSATVEASGSATVRAFGSATVRAFGSATVEASDSATVEASGSATVQASDSATVQAYGRATVRAFGRATAIRTRWHWGGYIKLADLAAVVDRRVDWTVTLHQAPWSDAPEGTT